MKIAIALGAAALTIGLSSAAFAATHHHHHPKPVMVASTCSILEHQFARAPKHKSMWLAKADWFAGRGSKLCSTGAPVRGAWDLRTALNLIGVAPKA